MRVKCFCVIGLSRDHGSAIESSQSACGWEQTDLAKKAGVAISTVRRMESFQGEIGARTSTLSLVTKALERAGIEFLDDGKPGVRMRGRG